MNRTFIETTEFQKRWKNLKLTQEDLREFQIYLLENPLVGPVIQGTGGVRKVRWARNDGKSGGVRVIYVDFLEDEETFLLTVYAKSDKANLSEDEKFALKTFVRIIKGEL